MQDIEELPSAIVNRLRHYFTTYKILPGEPESYDVSIDGIYGREHAEKVVTAAMQDYRDEYGDD